MSRCPTICASHADSVSFLTNSTHAGLQVNIFRRKTWNVDWFPCSRSFLLQQGPATQRIPSEGNTKGMRMADSSRIADHRCDRRRGQRQQPDALRHSTALRTGGRGQGRPARGSNIHEGRAWRGPANRRPLPGRHRRRRSPRCTRTSCICPRWRTPAPPGASPATRPAVRHRRQSRRGPSKARGKVAWLDSFFEYLSDSFRPILGVLLGASLVIAIVNVIVALGIVPMARRPPVGYTQGHLEGCVLPFCRL